MLIYKNLHGCLAQSSHYVHIFYSFYYYYCFKIMSQFCDSFICFDHTTPLLHLFPNPISLTPFPYPSNFFPLNLSIPNDTGQIFLNVWISTGFWFTYLELHYLRKLIFPLQVDKIASSTSCTQRWDCMPGKGLHRPSHAFITTVRTHEHLSCCVQMSLIACRHSLSLAHSTPLPQTSLSLWKRG